MRIRQSILIIVILAVSISLLGGCDKFPGASARSDGQVLDDVKAHLSADASVTNKQIDVGVKDGVVTLSGKVESETERLAAANDASTVSGVKTVVNNLQVLTASAAPVETPKPQPVQHSPAPAKSKPSAQHAKQPAKDMPAIASVPPVSSAPAPVVTAQAAPPVNDAPKPPEPVVITIPVGTRIAVRLDQALSSESNQAGDPFRGTLDAPITDDQKVIIPAHTTIEGRVTDAKGAAKFKGSSVLTLELTELSYAGKTYSLVTDHWTREGVGRGKNTAAKVGGGAALGALIGGLIGGGKGAAIGAGVGAGAGTTAQAATKGQKIELPSETVLTFRLESPVTVTLPPAAPKTARDSLPSDNN